MYVKYAVDPSFFKDKPIKQALKELREMYEVLDFAMIETVESHARNRGHYDAIVKKFSTDLNEAVEAGATKFGIDVDMQGKSIAAVRAGLLKAVEKCGQGYRVVTDSEKEKVYLLWIS
jgi:hypothetical protein